MRYGFDDYVVDVRRRALTRGEVEISIGDRAFGVLVELVANAGHLRSKPELLDTVWHDVVVGEDNLTKAIGEIRSALGDSPAEAQFVRTVHRRGYVFVAAVSCLENRDAGALTPPAVVSARAPNVVPGWRSWLIPALITMGLGLAATLVAIRFLNDRSPSPSDQARPFVGWSMKQVERVPLGVFKPSFSPVGEAMVAVTSNHASGVHSLVLIARDLETPLRLTDDLEVRGPSPVFSADGRRVWFTTFHHHPERGLQPRIMEVPAVGGEPGLLVENASAASPAPDGRSMAIARVAEGGTSITVRQENGEELIVADVGFWPRFSPDGRWIAYTTSNPEGGNGLIWVVRPDGGDRRRLNHRPSQIYGLCWTADSRFVVFASDVDGTMDLWISGVDGADPTTVTRSPGACTSPAVSMDGAQLVFAFSVIDVALHIASSLAGTPETKLDLRGIAGAAISPGGERIALTAQSDSSAPAVSVIEIASGRRHAVSGLRCEQIRWAPDGETLVAIAPSPDRSTMWVWRIPVDGGAAEPLTTGAERWAWPDLAPDEKHLAAVRRVDGGWDVVVVDLVTGETEVVASSPEVQGLRWSPDGSRLAWSGGYRPADAQSSGVWVASLDDDTVRRVAVDGAWPAWEPSGMSLVFVRFLEQTGLWRVQTDSGTLELVQEFSGKLGSYQIEGIDIGSAGHPLLVLTKASKPTLYSLQPPIRGFSE